MITPRQIKAARALVGWTTEDLAVRTSLTADTITNIETGRTQAREGSIERIVKAFEKGGAEFLANQGVRLKSNDVEIYEGRERFEEFTNFVFEQIKTYGGDICLSVTDERLFSKYRTNTPEHYQRMQDLSDRGVIKSFRILANKSNFASQYTYNTYKWQPEETMAPTAFYTFADYLALISFEHITPPYVLVVRSAPLADSYRRAFDIAWAMAKDPPKQKGAEK